MNMFEPGLLLIYKSVDKYPQLSERLIEYLYSYVHMQDETRALEFSLSVQKVLSSAEKYRIIPGKIQDLINNSKLSSGI